MSDDSKRSDLACPMIISGSSRSTSQARERQRISENFEKKLAVQTSPKARAINERNNQMLADTRRKLARKHS